MQDMNYLSNVGVPRPERTVGGDIARLTGAQTQHVVQGKVLNSHYTKRTDFSRGKVLARRFVALAHIAPMWPMSRSKSWPEIRMELPRGRYLASVSGRSDACVMAVPLAELCRGCAGVWAFAGS